MPLFKKYKTFFEQTMHYSRKLLCIDNIDLRKGCIGRIGQCGEYEIEASHTAVCDSYCTDNLNVSEADEVPSRELIFIICPIDGRHSSFQQTSSPLTE